MKMQLEQHTENTRLRKTQSILGARIDAISWDEAIAHIVASGAAHESAYICICNVHSVVTAARDPDFMKIINNADMATPDGAPIAWALRALGFPAQERINGPDLMWKYLEAAQRLHQTVFFYGSTDATLEKLRKCIAQQFPQLQVGGMHAPPFRPLAFEEDAAETATINRSGANVVFVGLGCPKQEQWMAAHQGKINAVMIGVGAAFDYHSGVVKRAPPWLQRHGLEWLYRLASEPRRLWKRYVITNTLFIIGFSRQLIRMKILNR